MTGSNPWDLTPGGWKTSSNALGSRVTKMVKEIPQWGIYFRRDTRFPCSEHYCSDSESSKFLLETCPFCYGTGYKTTPQLAPSKVTLGVGILGREGTMMQEAGLIARFSVIVDFPRAVYPKFDDFFVTCEWNLPVSELPKAAKPKPLRINNVYMLKQINDHFEREIGWFNCGAEVYEVDRSKLTGYLPIIKDLEVIDTTWQQNSFW